MRVALRVEARHDLLDGAWFYEQQREGIIAIRVKPLMGFWGHDGVTFSWGALRDPRL